MLIIVGSREYQLYAEREAKPGTSLVSGFFLYARTESRKTV